MSRIKGRWWAVILLFFPVLTVLAGILAKATGATQQPFDLAGIAQQVTHPASLLTLIAFTLIIGPLPEEIGWRGYLLDQLQTRWRAFPAGLFVGLLNWAWHFPLFLLPGYSDAFRSVPPNMIQMFFVVILAVLLYTWVYNNTGRSVLAVILFHFSGNFWGEFLGLATEAQPYRMALTIMAAAFIVWRYGTTTLQRGLEPAAGH
jgi:membrane protease YdiL (CAAX protease family)